MSIIRAPGWLPIIMAVLPIGFGMFETSTVIVSILMLPIILHGILSMKTVQSPRSKKPARTYPAFITAICVATWAVKRPP